ncbi:MAG: ABC transporter substrate-binding protein [Clostridium sp.]
MKKTLKKVITITMSMLILISGMLLQGCAEEKESKKSDEKEVVSKNIEKSKRPKDELVMCMGTRPPGEFDPKKRWGLYSQSHILHSTLLKRDADLNVVTDLAKSYDVSKDGLVWTFPLKTNFKFSNGEAVTAEDVKFSYEMLKEHGLHWDLSFVKKIEIKDKDTIVFHLTEPRSTFIAQLTEIVILPRNHYDDNYAQNPIGSGPYKLVQWDKDQQAIFEVNEHYAGEKPYFKKFTLLFLKEDAALAAAKAGEVDMISVLPNFANEKVEGMKLMSFESNDVRGVSFPTVKPQGKNKVGNEVGNEVTSDLAIRKAITMGLSREKIIQSVLEGHGKKAYSLCDKMPWWNEETVIEDENIEGAKKVLADAGWKDTDGDKILEKDGLKAEFDLYYPTADKVRTDVAINVAEMSEGLGIKINLIGSNWDEMQTKMHANPILFAGGRHHAHQIYTMHHPSASGVAYGNIAYLNNEKITGYLDKAMHSPTQEEANKYWKLAQWDGETGFSSLGEVPYAWLVRLDHLYLGDETIDVGKQPVHTHGHEWSLLFNIGEWKRK